MAKAGHEIQAQKRRGQSERKDMRIRPPISTYVACTRRRLLVAVAFTVLLEARLDQLQLRFTAGWST
jgi:hypothetical protein